MTTTGALGFGARHVAVASLSIAVVALAGCGIGQPVPIPPPRQVGSSGLVVAPQNISMSPGQATTVTATEKGYSGPFTESDDCTGIVGIVETGGSTFDVTALSVGLCTIKVTDQSGGWQNVGVSIQSVVIGGQ